MEGSDAFHQCNSGPTADEHTFHRQEEPIWSNQRMKVDLNWECSEDLVEYLLEDEKFVENHVKGRNVLELGCGHSLPSIYCLVKGQAALCAFQDYVS